MNEMAACKRQAFILAMKFTWMIYPAGAAAAGTSCAVTVTQPRSLEADSASNVTIPCTFSTEGCHGSSPTVLWFRYLAQAHENLCTPKCTQSKKFQATSAIPEKRASLMINNASVEDSAIYFCGVAFADSADPLSKQTGEGTTLTIRGKKHNAGVYVMAAILPLLFIYIAAVFVSFKVFSKPKTKETERGSHNTGAQIKASGQSISQAIAQELRKKKKKLNRRPQQRLEKETIYQNK